MQWRQIVTSRYDNWVHWHDANQGQHGIRGPGATQQILELYFLLLNIGLRNQKVSLAAGDLGLRSGHFQRRQISELHALLVVRQKRLRGFQGASLRLHVFIGRNQAIVHVQDLDDRSEYLRLEIEVGCIQIDLGYRDGAAVHGSAEATQEIVLERDREVWSR